jgi:hypothetical protein
MENEIRSHRLDRQKFSSAADASLKVIDPILVLTISLMWDLWGQQRHAATSALPSGHRRISRSVRMAGCCRTNSPMQHGHPAAAMQADTESDKGDGDERTSPSRTRNVETSLSSHETSE